MAFRCKMDIAVLLSCICICTLLVPVALGDVVCEDLPKEVCAYSVSGSGRRCVLGRECKRSGVVAGNAISNHIESDRCMRACGVTRNSVGISAYAFLDPPFTAKLCSPDCRASCPNIRDLYAHLAAGAGLALADVCQPHRRLMGEKAQPADEDEGEGQASPPGPDTKASDVEFPDYEPTAPTPAPAPY